MNCAEIKREISEMSVDELRSAASNAHIHSCVGCHRYLQDMLVISDGLATLVIPRPVGMKPPAKQRSARDKLVALVAAVLTLLLVGSLAAYVVHHYTVAAPANSGSRRMLITAPGVPKTATPQPSVK